MLFDLWNVTLLLISDYLELIGSHFPVESTYLLSTISLPFLLFLICLLAIGVLGWRTTFIPELPEVPRPPYVIQISSTPTLNNNGEHNTLADVRLLSSGVDVDNLRRSFPTLLVRERGGGGIRLAARTVTSSSNSSSGSGVDNPSQNQGGGTTGNNNNNTTTTGSPGHQIRTQLRFHHVRQQQQQQQRPNLNPQQQNVSSSGAILQGLLRPGSVIRPLIQRATAAGGNHVQNLIVYHRVNVYHHHHHHHHSENGQISSESTTPALSSSSNQDPQSISGDATTTTTTPTASTSNTSGNQSNRSSRSHSVDSSTQYEEYVEGNVEDSSLSSETYEHLIDNPSSVNALLAEDDHGSSSLVNEVNSTRDSSSSEGNIDNQNQLPEEEEREQGVRLRRTVAFSNIRSSSSGGSNNTTLLATDSSVEPTSTANDGIIMDKLQTDESTGTATSTPPAAADIEINDIRFTIKFLNDTQMEVTTHAEEKVLDFKRRHFATELAENKKVRLIFNGRVLEDDAQTLRDSGIFDQCVVHCLIVSRPPPPPQTSSSGGSSSIGRGNNNNQRANTGILRGGTPEPGIFFVGFVGVFLIFLWFICFHFGQHLFTQSAVVSLTVLTAIFLVGLVAFYLPVHPANAA